MMQENMYFEGGNLKIFNIWGEHIPPQTPPCITQVRQHQRFVLIVHQVSKQAGAATGHVGSDMGDILKWNLIQKGPLIVSMKISLYTEKGTSWRFLVTKCDENHTMSLFNPILDSWYPYEKKLASFFNGMGEILIN